MFEKCVDNRTAVLNTLAMTRTDVPAAVDSQCDRDAATAPRLHPRRTSPAVYRQRRLVAMLLLVIVTGLVPAVVLAGTAPARTDAVSAVRPPLAVVVGQGDTLWDLALAHAPSTQDPVAYVSEVIVLNDVKAAALEPGMVLRLP